MEPSINHNPLTVSSYIGLVNEKLKVIQSKIVGEISQISFPSSGHVYFSLKDKTADAILDCVIWKSSYQLYGIKLEVGMEIIVSGAAAIYPPTGRLKFIARSVELVGEGALLKAYQELKQKLILEGLLTQDRKRKLPDFPCKIGVITSKQGSVIHDFMNNLAKRGFEITLIDARVEGLSSLPDLYNALQTLKKRSLDVIVVMRGGGSIQSLAAFDNEKLIRAIAGSDIPVISAIGHHKDVPLCALVSDIMVSTPTAAANLLSQSWENAAQAIDSDSTKVIFTFNEIINDAKLTLQLGMVNITDKFKDIIGYFSTAKIMLPEYLLKISRTMHNQSDQLSRLSQGIINNLEKDFSGINLQILAGKDKIFLFYGFLLKKTREELISREKIISSNDPMRQLALGFSLLRNSKGKIIKSIKDVSIKEILSLSTSDGIISSVVKSVEKK